MRAVVYSEHGDTSVLRLVDRPVREPGPGEVRVVVRVSGVNPTDWKSRSGLTPRGSFDEVVPNQDGAGVIEALGEAVSGLLGVGLVTLEVVDRGRHRLPGLLAGANGVHRMTDHEERLEWHHGFVVLAEVPCQQQNLLAHAGGSPSKHG